MKIQVWAAGLVMAVSVASLAVGGIVAGQEEEPAAEPAVTFVDTEENTIGKEVWGEWSMDNDLTKRTAGEIPEGMGNFEFKKDEETKARIQAALEKTLKEIGDAEGEEADFIRRAAAGVFCTGRLILKQGDQNREADFAQVSMWGEPVLLILEQEGEETDWESVRVAFVRDPEGDGDLLFIGGDHKDEPYVAFKRKQ